jgi:hypothetical protein
MSRTPLAERYALAPPDLLLNGDSVPGGGGPRRQQKADADGDDAQADQPRQPLREVLDDHGHPP